MNSEQAGSGGEGGRRRRENKAYQAGENIIDVCASLQSCEKQVDVLFSNGRVSC